MATATVLKMTPKVKEVEGDFASKMVLLRVRFGIPGNTRRVSAAQVTVDADKEMVKVQKLLLDSPELEAVRAYDNNLRLWLYANFSQFDIGVMMVPLGMVDVVEDRIKTYLEERKKLIKVFGKAYPKRCELAQARLRGLSDVRDYPAVEYVLGKFSFTHNYVSFAVPGQLASVRPELFKQEREKAAQLMKEAAAEFKVGLRVAFAEMTKKLADKLTDETNSKTGEPVQKRLHESAVKKLQEWVNTFDLRNAMDDSELKVEVAKARKLISGVDIEALRSTDTVRDQVRQGMEKISSKLENLIETAPKRKFKFAELEGD